MWEGNDLRGAKHLVGRNIQWGAKRLEGKQPGENVLRAKWLGEEMVWGWNDLDSLNRLEYMYLQL